MYFIVHIAALCHRVFVDGSRHAEERMKTHSRRSRSWIKRMMVRIFRAGTKIWSNNDRYASTWKCPSATKTRISLVRLELARHQREIRKSPHERKHAAINLLAYWVLAMPVTAKDKPRQAIFDTDSSEIGVDNRCSACISSVIEDFEAPPTICKRVIRGFGGTKTSNVMQGTLVWQWLDESGMVHKFRIPNSYYVQTKETTRLLSPQHASQELKNQGYGQMTETTNDTTCTLTWANGKFKLTIPLDPTSNVATFRLAPGYDKFFAFCAAAQIPQFEEEDIITEMHDIMHAEAAWISDEETSDRDAETQLQTGRQAFDADGTLTDWTSPPQTDFNLDGPIEQHVIPDEEERGKADETMTMQLLKMHQNFGHISFHRLQTMAKLGHLPKGLATCPIPVCSACLYGKQTRRPWRARTSQSAARPATPLQPGDVVSVDQMVSPIPGFVAQMTGRLTTSRYKCATIYVDQASRLSYVHLQRTADASETLEGKAQFEKYAADRGVKIKHYHADNGIFRANAWVQHCTINGQGLTFAGVNAHHQNGIAEKRIRDLQELARTQLIFAKRRWPQAIEPFLWPYALRMANQVLNETPLPQDPTHRTASQIFSSTVVDPNPKHFKPFGCPVYVLKENLQHAGGIQAKWSDRSRVGIYLGQSPRHNRNVALVLSLDTGLVSPQFHVAFDAQFHTVRQEGKNWTYEWQEKSGLVEKEKRQPEKLTTPGTVPNNKRKRDEGTRQNTPAIEPMPPQREPEPTLPEAGNGVPEQMELQQQSQTTANRQTQNDTGTYQTRAGRRVKPNPKYAEVATMTEEETEEQWNRSENIFCMQAITEKQPTQLTDTEPLRCYKATSDPDTMYHHQAMKEPDAAYFKEAMKKEVEDQFKNGNYRVVRRSDIPKDATVFPSVWQMKRKRDIKTRKVKKYKARMNFDGSRMLPNKHFDPNRVYAPVASWNSIRLQLIMAVIFGWTTRQLDYVLAFPQAPVDRDIYMEIPRGFEIEGAARGEYVLQLKRNVYGQKQAGRVWNDYLHEKLTKELGFTQSEYDECVYFRGSVMYVLYTDDSILAGPDEVEVDKVIDDIKRVGLDITVEGDLQDFLGVNIEKKEDGTIHLTQPHLIDQILEDLRLTRENVTTRSTPARSSTILRRHEDSPPFDGHFNYRSVIGKLNYLERGSRPDIAYIVHQCARFTADPRMEHGAALKWLGRYLKGTRDKGLILKPNLNKQMEVYVDADFAGNWNYDEGDHRDTARSRHGYFITYAGIPISWKSQLQGEICLSSTESEYTGLSHALREAIPIMGMINEMKELGFQVKSGAPKAHCKVFEDNSGALEMAKIHKYRPRTKHICTKLHHFRDYVMRGEITIHPIDTKDQVADFLTKPVNESILVKLRKLIMGW